MTMTGPSGGGGISKDDVLVLLFGSAFSGTSTASGSGIRYLDAQHNTEVS